MITDREIGWLAGILEGEGFFGFNGRQRMWQVLNGYKPKMTEMKSADLLQLVVNK